MRKIPAYIVDEKTRMCLVEINQHLEVLDKWHKELGKKAKSKTITDSEKKLWKEIIKAHNNLSKRFDQLAPSLVDAIQASMKAKKK